MYFIYIVLYSYYLQEIMLWLIFKSGLKYVRHGIHVVLRALPLRDEEFLLQDSSHLIYNTYGDLDSKVASADCC